MISKIAKVTFHHEKGNVQLTRILLMQWSVRASLSLSAIIVPHFKVILFGYAFLLF